MILVQYLICQGYVLLYANGSHVLFNSSIPPWTTIMINGHFEKWSLSIIIIHSTKLNYRGTIEKSLGCISVVLWAWSDTKGKNLVFCVFIFSSTTANILNIMKNEKAFIASDHIFMLNSLIHNEYCWQNIIYFYIEQAFNKIYPRG